VNFDGTTNVGGNCTIRASGNVSTVADNGAGDYTVNFTTAMPDANYSVTAMFQETILIMVTAAWKYFCRLNNNYIDCNPSTSLYGKGARHC
jgi:hypothetical protein